MRLPFEPHIRLYNIKWPLWLLLRPTWSHDAKKLLGFLQIISRNTFLSFRVRSRIQENSHIDNDSDWNDWVHWMVAFSFPFYIIKLSFLYYKLLLWVHPYGFTTSLAWMSMFEAMGQQTQFRKNENKFYVLRKAS